MSTNETAAPASRAGSIVGRASIILSLLGMVAVFYGLYINIMATDSPSYLPNLQLGAALQKLITTPFGIFSFQVLGEILALVLVAALTIVADMLNKFTVFGVGSFIVAHYLEKFAEKLNSNDEM